MSGRGCGLVLGVGALFLIVFVPLALRVQGGRARTLDAERLRRTYVAIALYETEHDGLPPARLLAIDRDMDALDYRSVADPEVGRGTRFPMDPFAPGTLGTLPFRVSWSYRYHWPEAGDPRATSLDPRRGLLADPWPGTILRVNMDGSLVERPNAEPGFASLFGK